ncbi:MAG: RNA methyltransferase [Acidimicrobiia bacterium]|nr:RNA methyltransferase [Acidimicrobiia bacterium]
MSGPPLGGRSAEIRRLRRLTRRVDERRSEGVVVLEGARVLEGALRRDAVVGTVYVDEKRLGQHAEVLEQARSLGVDVRSVEAGVLERVSEVVTSPGILGVATFDTYPLQDVLGGATLLLVAVDVADPGNAGTLLRSAEASGAAAVVFCGTSVDVRNPKVTRASAGACFGIPVVEDDDPMHTLDAIGAAGLRRLGAVGRGGADPDRLSLEKPVAFVVGSEAHGLDAEVLDRTDDTVSIPMKPRAESLNVGVAASVLLFEAARVRRIAGTGASP